jgi:hypothetical protein
VRCAQCRHSCFQPGPESAEAEQPLEADASLPAEVEAAVQSAGVSAGASAGFSGPAAAAAPIAASVDPLPDLGYDLWDGVEPEPPARRRGSLAWLWLLLLFLALAAAIGGALTWYGQPDWLPFRQAALGSSKTDLTLNFPPSQTERTTLADGTEFFGARGTVTNVGPTRRRVPPIEVVLRDARKQIVFRWEVVPPKSQLAPGETMTINEAVTDVPHNATIPEIGWKAG